MCKAVFKLISKFQVKSEVSACEFRIFYCIPICIRYYVVYFSCGHNKSPIQRLPCQINEFVKNIFHTTIMCLKASTDVKISTFFGEKWGDEAVDHKMDF